MNTLTYAGTKKSVCLLFLVMSCVSILCAQTNTPGQYIETNLPVDVCKGFVKVGGRFGVLIAGGKTVYSNDTFTLTTRGVKAKWKVLEVVDKKARFARALPDKVSPYATPPDCAPNLSELVMLLDKEATLYKQASTQLLKDKIVAAARLKAQNWCSSNQIVCVQGKLADATMMTTNTARVRLETVDFGQSATVPNSNLYVKLPLEETINVSKEIALTFEAGNIIVLAGRVTFLPAHDSYVIGEKKQFNDSFTYFRMGSAPKPFIGAIRLTDIKYDIFNPKNETVR